MVKATSSLPFEFSRQGWGQDYLSGQFLVAMPHLTDERFERAVIFMCSHTPRGAMGLIINKPATHITFPELLGQLKIERARADQQIPINVGGPVEPGRGFVLHAATEFASDTTIRVTPDVSLTATVDVLRAIANGDGPHQALLALGYAGWGPGQLEQEIRANGWLHCQADEDLIFDTDLEAKWRRAIGTLGISPYLLSSEAGHA